MISSRSINGGKSSSIFGPKESIKGVIVILFESGFSFVLISTGRKARNLFLFGSV